MTQVNTIASSINTAIDAFGGNVEANSVQMFGQTVPVSSIIIGVIIAVIVALVLLGGIKRIGSVTEKLVPFMAVIYIAAALIVIIANIGSLGTVFGMIFKGAFSADAALGGATGIMIKTTIQKGVARGVFSNEAGLGSAPMAHAASSESDPVKQGLYGIFEVFMDTIVIWAAPEQPMSPLPSAASSETSSVLSSSRWASPCLPFPPCFPGPSTAPAALSISSA